MTEVLLDKKGRVLIPLELRKELALRFGQRLEIKKRDEKIVIAPVVDKKKFVSELKGCISTPFDAEKLKEIWGAGHAHD